MTLESEAATDGGEDTYEADLAAAIEADSEPVEATQPDAADKGEEEQAKAAEEGDKKPPLSAEELQKRYENQKRATSAERQKRREIEQNTQRQIAELTQRLEAITAGQGQQGGERPNPQEDPIGYLEWVDAKLSEADARSAEQAQRDQQRQEQTRHVQAVVARASEYEADFREATPDYDQAADFLYEIKKAEYADAGYEDQDAHNAVMAEFLTRADRAMQAGKDPAEIVYGMAKRLGYGAAAEAKVEETARAKLAAIEKGQKVTSPLATAGGRGGDDLDAASIANLEGAAFDKAMDKLIARATRMGL